MFAKCSGLMMKKIQNYDTIIGFKSKIVINQKPI